MKFAAFFTVLVFLGESSYGQVSLRQKAVDLVLLKDGTRLLGAVVSDDRGKDLQMLLRVSWLKENAPDLLESIVAKPAKEPQDADSVEFLVRKFVEELKAEPNPDIQKIGYLEERLIDLSGDDINDAAEGADLALISLPQRLIRRKLVQPSRGAGVAGIAVLNQVDQVESISKKDVIAELDKIPASRLLRQIPDYESTADNNAQSNVQLEFQKLLVNTDRILGKTCRLIYQTGNYIDEQNATAADLQQLTTQMLTGQMQSQLQALLNGEFAKPAGNQSKPISVGAAKTLPAAAAQIAKRQQADVVEVSEMEMNVTGGAASVRIGLYYQLPGKPDWTLVASVVGRATSGDVSADQKQRIANDPTVQGVTQLFSGLGSTNSNISNAISLGAVVEIAQGRARQALENALDSQAGPSTVGMKILHGSVPLPTSD